MTFRFMELAGVLVPSASADLAPQPGIVLSTLERGGCESRSGSSFGIKYVAQGTEIYRYGGRSYTVSGGRFLIVPSGAQGEVEISPSQGTALGLCLSLPESNREPSVSLAVPMLFSAHTSRLGRMVMTGHRRLRETAGERKPVAGRLLVEAVADLEFLVEETLLQLDDLNSLRPATRYDLLLRLNVARAYLHDVTERPVHLDELARVAGASRFHLLRNFRTCFGLPPATYHRRLRLSAAKEAVERGQLTCGDAAQRFGFADGSSFSHAYRRTFGVPPVRQRSVPAEIVR